MKLYEIKTCSSEQSIYGYMSSTCVCSVNPTEWRHIIGWIGPKQANVSSADGFHESQYLFDNKELSHCSARYPATILKSSCNSVTY